MLATEQKVFPCDKLIFPLPPALLQTAKKLKITPEELVQKVLYGRGKYSLLVEVVDGIFESRQFVPGHVWSAEPKNPTPGPRYRSDVMIIDKMLDKEALENRRIFSGESGMFLHKLLKRSGHKDPASYYVTTMLKTTQPDPIATYKAYWTQYQLHFVLQEILLVRPKYMLLMGADVVKGFFKKNTKIADLEGRVHKLKFKPPGEKSFTVKAIVTMRPEAMLYSRSGYQEKKFIKQLSLFQALVAGNKLANTDKLPEMPGHRIIDNEYDLLQAIKQTKRDSKKFSKKLICIDCEWQGDHPQSHGAYLRCAQFSGKAGTAYCAALTFPGGAPRFKVRRDPKKPIEQAHAENDYTTENASQVVARHLAKMLNGFRMCGHQIKADLEWLEAYGFEQPNVYEFPEKPEQCKESGPFDTLLAAHAYDEQADLGLRDQLAVHLPQIPNYDAHLDAGIKEFIANSSKYSKKGDLNGYGELPDEVLYPYALFDADAGLQLALFYLDRLDRDQNGLSCWPGYFSSIRAFPIAHEITKVGMLFDKDQADKLTFAFMRKRQELLYQLYQRTNWFTLNMDSPFHVRELLFGAKYNGSKDKKRIRPPKALSLLAEPVLSAGKYQKDWEEIRAKGLEYKTNVSAGAKVIGLMTLNAEHTEVRRRDIDGTFVSATVDASAILKNIREFRAVHQQLKGPLRPPVEPPMDREDWPEDEAFYEKGIPGSVCLDNRVRTSILQIKETGRWASINPPLQNLSSQVEKLLQKIFGSDYPGSVKNVFVADKDYFFIPVDLKGAELRMCAVQSLDPAFITATERISLPEDHPDFLDIHGEIAVEAFNLPCAPTKHAIEEYGRDDLRTGAKTVIFGKFYGQSIAAAVIAVRMRGTNATMEQLQRISDTIDEKYPGLDSLFDKCRKRVEKGYLVTWNGRIRHFPKTNDEQKFRAMQREALNAPIQGGVADFVGLLCHEAFQYRKETGADFKVVLQKHDELIFMVHKSWLKRIWHEAIPHWFNKLFFWPADLEGRRIKGQPDFKFYYDRELMKVWGKHLPKAEQEELLGKGFNQ
jgi:uracil-DNA glycosylase family 4